MQLKQTTQNSLKFVSDCIENNNFSKETKNTVYFAVDYYLASMGVEKFFEQTKDYSEYNKDVFERIKDANTSIVERPSFYEFEKKIKRGLQYVSCSEFVYFYDKISPNNEEKIAFIKNHTNHFDLSETSNVFFHMLFKEKNEEVNSFLKSHRFDENSCIYICHSNFNIKSFNNIYNKIEKSKFSNLRGLVRGYLLSAESILEKIDVLNWTIESFDSAFFYMFLLYKENNTTQLNQFIVTMLDKFEYFISICRIRIPFFSVRISFIVYFSNCLESNARKEILSRIVKLSLVPADYTNASNYLSERSLFMLMKSIINLEIDPDSF